MSGCTDKEGEMSFKTMEDLAVTKPCSQSTRFLVGDSACSKVPNNIFELIPKRCLTKIFQYDLKILPYNIQIWRLIVHE